MCECFANPRLPFENLFAVAGFYISGAHDCSFDMAIFGPIKSCSRKGGDTQRKALNNPLSTQTVLTAPDHGIVSIAQNHAGLVLHLRNFATVNQGLFRKSSKCGRSCGND